MSEPNANLEGARAFPERLLRSVALIGGLMLFAIMFLVTLSVFFRYVLNQPILGDQELVEIGMAVVVMMAMPYAAYQGAHIRVDILDERLGERGRFLGDAFARALSCYVLLLLIRKTWDKTLDAWKYNDVTNMIEIPVWIAYGAITLGLGLFGLVLAYQLVGQFRHGTSGYE